MKLLRTTIMSGLLSDQIVSLLSVRYERLPVVRSSKAASTVRYLTPTRRNPIGHAGMLVGELSMSNVLRSSKPRGLLLAAMVVSAATLVLEIFAVYAIFSPTY